MVLIENLTRTYTHSVDGENVLSKYEDNGVSWGNNLILADT